MCKIKTLQALYKNAVSYHGNVHDTSHCLYLVHSSNTQANEWVCANAAKKGHYACLAYAHQVGCCMTSLTITYAAMYGHRDCIAYAYTNGVELNPRMFHHAAAGGHLDCFKYMHDCLKSECIKMQRPRFTDRTSLHDKWVCEYAARNNHLPCIIFAHENGYPLTEDACRCALFSGHFECFVYLFAHVRPQFELHDIMKTAIHQIMGDEASRDRLFEKSSLRCLAYILREHAQGRIQKDTGKPAFLSDVEKEAWVGAMAYRKRVSIIENACIMYKVKKRVESYKQELIAKTWHPARFEKWCLTEDEKDDLVQDLHA